MRYKVLFTLLFSVFSHTTFANWEKINDLDYTWGPFKIYNITLFTENGEYQPQTRPLMLSLKYDKPVDGRDFAISIARSWASLDIKVPEQNKVIERLRRLLPDLKSGDLLSYIALEDKGYFVVNDQIIPEEFDKTVNDAIVAVWLDPRVDLSKKITVKKINDEKVIHVAAYTVPEVSDENQVIEKTASGLFQSFALKQAQFSEKVLEHPAIGVPTKAIVENTQPAPAQDAAVQKSENVAENRTQVVEVPSQTVPTTSKNTVEAQPAAQNTEAPKSETEKQPESTPKQDPENPEKEIRPIEDPMPKNKRSS
ncbi:hypothetical protein [Actinobacillus minor]|uniref:hypothetical protein n=1 Tax=Actinobacillus minor TaxID=51047 RepID=UPI0023F35DA5|nr:hypothetical protein [Actinobacillus minor]MDD6910640.1 hypothetical protein [Actinobacillus minor]MDY4713151.1 hypothetical protein [Actinobacillus minor]